MDYRSSVFYRDGGVSVTRLDGTLNFDVSKIFDCGQTFRFDRIEGSQHGAEWGGVVRGSYFDLDREYGRIDEDLLSRSDKPELRDAVEKGRGIRILRQEPWETLCSFIISQNNNIPRIKSLVSALSREAGEPAVCDGMTARGASEREYSFPVPAAVCRLGEERLREMKTGFRAGYICGAAEAQLPGRGPSLADVAACALDGIRLVALFAAESLPVIAVCQVRRAASFVTERAAGEIGSVPGVCHAVGDLQALRSPCREAAALVGASRDLSVKDAAFDLKRIPRADTEASDEAAAGNFRADAAVGDRA